MGNKIFYGIIAVIVVAFIAIFVVMNNNSSNPDQLSDSGYYPYTDMEPEDLSGPTIDEKIMAVERYLRMLKEDRKKLNKQIIENRQDQANAKNKMKMLRELKKETVE